MNSWGWLLLAYIAAVTVPLFVIDIRSRRLPNRLVLPGYLVAAVSLVLVGATHGDLSATVIPWSVFSAELIALISGGAYMLFLLLLSLTGGMGMGDVKLAGVLGIAAGLVDPTVSALSPLLAFGLGGLASAVILIARRGTRTSRIPFGPFMLLGFWIAVALGLLLPS